MTTLCRADYTEPPYEVGHMFEEDEHDAESAENLLRLCEMQRAVLAEQSGEIAYQRDEIRHLMTRRVNLLLIVAGLSALGGWLLRGWLA